MDDSTDGIPEAMNGEKAFFGTDRLLDALNEAEDDTPKGLLEHVVRSVDAFAGTAPQFDGLTMLSVTLKGQKRRRVTRL